MGHFDYLNPDQKFLAEAAFVYFKEKYGSLSIKKDCEIHKDLNWQPTFFFKKNKYEIIACELSEEKIYPQIFKLINNDLTGIPVTIHCYSICPQTTCIDAQNQKEFAELKKHGHGLLSVESNGSVLERAKPTPSVFYISDLYFNDDLCKKFSGLNKIALVNSFDTYKNDPLSGVRELCDHIEAIINKAAEVVNVKFQKNIGKNETINNKLKALNAITNLNNASSSIGAIMGYYSKVRNASNHAPINQKQAHQKYRLCRENYINGSRVLYDFIFQFKSLGIKLSV